jgi:iron complex outermembrane receptor protein
MKNTHAIAVLLTTVSTQFLVTEAAFAQSSDTAGETIIVTARRVEERLQDVPISISVVSQDRLTKSNVSSSDDLIRVVPGLQAQSRYSSEQSTFSIRGFAQELRTSATVGTYFGEVIAPRGGGISLQGGDGAGPGNLFDLQNVQVLKGPQGTLFGRNTTGGAVLLTPKKPTDRFEGYLEGSYGNYDMLRIQGVVNLPLADFARLRLGIDRQVRDGFLHNVSGIGPKDFGDTDYTALRASLVLDISPDIENYTVASYLKSTSNGIIPQNARANPASTFGAPAGRGGATDQVARRIASGDPYQVEQKLLNPIASTESWQVINTTTLTLSDSLTLKNIASLSNITQDLRQDIFGTNILPSALSPLLASFNATGYVSTSFAISPPGTHLNDQNNFTEELQLQGRAFDNKLNYQLGLYYEHSTPGGLSTSTAPGAGAVCRRDLPLGATLDVRCRNGTSQLVTATLEFINMAAFAQGTYAFSDQFKATAGIRYTYDRTRGDSTGLGYTFTGPSYVAPIPNAATNGCVITFAAYPNCRAILRSSDKKPTWTINLQYMPSNDAMLYATYSRGYRQGAVTPSVPTKDSVFGPEKLDSYEVGAKLSFEGSVSGNFNVAAYYTGLSAQQIQLGLTSTSGNGSATVIYNAGKSRIYGVDVDGSLTLSRMFRIDASANYLNTKVKSLDVPSSFPGYEIVLPAALAGDPLNFAPKWSLNFGGTVTLPLDESVGRVELSAVYRYTSSYASSSARNPGLIGSGSSVLSTPVKQVDANFDWRGVGGSPVDLALFVSNLTNQTTITFRQPLYNSFGFDSQLLGRPRMYGARIRVRFGN